jgi:hypothetical protein
MGIGVLCLSFYVQLGVTERLGGWLRRSLGQGIRVTRLGDFSPVGRLFALGSF